MTVNDLLRTRLPYTGEAPFGSCFQQGAANVLEAMGLERAELAIGATWGVSWQGGAKLGGSGRWTESIATACGLRVRWIHADSWPRARAVEGELLNRHLPVIAGVDSFGIPSPHKDHNHLVHAVIVLDADADGVRVCDPMNQPRPTRIEIDRYAELRAAECVDRFQMLACEGEIKSQIDPVAAAASLAFDAARSSQGDEVALAGFADWIEENGTDVDVSEVAAERLYAARLLSAAAEREERLRVHATALGSLARRWYLLHTVVLESRRRRLLAPVRISGMLAHLGRREVAARSALLSSACEIREECLA